MGMLAVFGCIWPVIYYFVLKCINAKRAAMDEREIRARYTEEELSDVGDTSPLFRYAVFIGHDWHWFKQETFRRKLELTYKDPKVKELPDRLWLCRLLVVLAQGET